MAHQTHPVWDGRPRWDDYFLEMAWTASKRANCLRRKVGALVVVGRSIVSTGYNGTPFGVKNCDAGGCPRCASEAFGRMEGYDWCLCIHAERNAISLAACQGTSTRNASLYTTSQPCFNCLTEIIQAGICEVIFDQPFTVPAPEYDDLYKEVLIGAGVMLRQHPFSRLHPVTSTVGCTEFV
jgi:dCMP deaminase